MANPILVLNFKTYREANNSNALRLSEIAYKIAKKHKLKIVVAPQFHDLEKISKFKKTIKIFAQHVDIFKPGAHTGSVIVENIKKYIDGFFINHSERKLSLKEIKQRIDLAKNHNLIDLVFVPTPVFAKKVALFRPRWIAIEPPELIGTGISVSKAKPDVIIKSLNLVKKVDKWIKVLCGAGISNEEDVRKALELGSEGVAIASAFVKSKKPKHFLEKIVKVLKEF